MISLKMNNNLINLPLPKVAFRLLQAGSPAQHPIMDEEHSAGLPEHSAELQGNSVMGGEHSVKHDGYSVKCQIKDKATGMMSKVVSISLPLHKQK